MSYAIGNVIFGLDLTEINEDVDRLEIDMDAVSEEMANFLEAASDCDLDDNLEGFSSYYSSGGPYPCVFGVYISSIDECGSIDIESWYATIRKSLDDHRKEYKRLFDALPMDIQNFLKDNYGEPKLQIVWSTS